MPAKQIRWTSMDVRRGRAGAKGIRVRSAHRRTQGRGGKGVVAFRVNDITGPVVDGRVVQDDDEVTLMSESGIVLRTGVDKIPKMGRYSRGVQMMDLKNGDRVATLARLPSGGTPNGSANNGNGDKEPVTGDS